MDLGRMPGIERAAARSALLRSNDPLFRSETLKSLARPRGVEPLTPRSVVWCSEFDGVGPIAIEYAKPQRIHGVPGEHLIPRYDPLRYNLLPIASGVWRATVWPHKGL
jgi:hypothetical protein